MHVLLLLCHCEAFTHVDQLRKTPAIQSLPVSMLSVGLSVWGVGRVGGKGRKDGGREEGNVGGREGRGGEWEEGRGGKGTGLDAEWKFSEHTTGDNFHLRKALTL